MGVIYATYDKIEKLPRALKTLAKTICAYQGNAADVYRRSIGLGPN